MSATTPGTATPGTTTPTLCPYCGVGCGLVAATEGGRLRSVEGDRTYPVNRGRTCAKPLELPAAVHAADRATQPLIRETRDGRFRQAGWDGAISHVAERLRRIIDEHGPDAVAFYISGQLLTEDYYAVNKLAKGFIGTNNVDSNSRLCMSSAVAGYQGSFGSDGPPPSYADLDLADCFLILGSNTAACHPIVWSRIAARRDEGALVICADPRPTATARASSLHLPVRPGADLPLLNAMLNVIDREGLADEEFLRRRTSGWEEARAVAAEWSPERAAAACGVEAGAIVEAARRFAGSRRSMTLWSMGANQSTVGTLKNRALINLCLATGNLGRKGAGPLSLTGQPNAMGGRETGGLSHLLPGYRKVASASDRAEMEAHWGVPGELPGISPEPGLPAVELFEALAAGEVKAVWIAATNPAVSLPDSDLARRALARAELVVVQDAYHPTETSARAHVVFPAAAWPEKEGTMTNSERRVGLARKLIDPPGEALPDWRIFARLAGALGFGEHFAWDGPGEVFDEFAACTAGRVCDLSGISHELLRGRGGVQWPYRAGSEGGGTERLYVDGPFPTDDGRARLAPTPHADPADPCDPDFPLMLTTGRVAEHWHTLTRTGKSERLRAAAPEPFVELHPEDAERSGVREGERARLVSRRGEVALRVACDPGLPRGVAFAPFHWGALHAPPGSGQVNGATHGARDPVSRQPELKAAAVRVEPAGHAPVARGSGLGRGRGANGSRRTRRLVVIGTGMAAQEAVEELTRRATRDEWRVTMLGEEPGAPYNRMLLSKLLAGEFGPAGLELRPAGWFEQHAVEVLSDRPATEIDPDARRVWDGAGGTHAYDALLIATGSRPFVPPIDGADRPGVHGFRTRADVAEITAAAAGAKDAIVIGGGLLGLEAAAGLRRHGCTVTVIEAADHLMPQQLDADAGSLLATKLAKLGIRSRCDAAVSRIEDGAVVLGDEERLVADLVVIAAGVRAETSLAQDAGLEVERGIVTDDEMRTSAPGVWAVGECAEHRGTVYGLVAPIHEQARAAGASIAGDPSAFLGTNTATTLKVAGIGVFAGGSPMAEGEELVWRDGRRDAYRRLVVSDDRLAAAILIGEVSEARELSALLRQGSEVPESLLLPPGPTGGEAATPVAGEMVCSCNAVSRTELERAIANGGLSTVLEVARATRATTGCGSCTGEVERVLRDSERSRREQGSSSRNMSVTEEKPDTETIPA